MYVSSYCMIIAFHPKPALDMIATFCSFQQKEDQLFDLSHLNDKILGHLDPITLKQLKDAGSNVLKKQSSFDLSEIFLIELKFMIDLLVKWFKQKHKSKFLETDTLTKEKCEK